eukprot:CAMPEP_0178914552 /NCGR_PEP_ID=MMETSP0786-20121207/11493_1 /TAXON_ID=186022 /ORGANISM="Thalassionema frauenfeldii, Strain CCMP 1798" /LENGTH=130 /DNA_ID=CAMNT_0020587481 /DNA_START=58 /DNA_END=450 /DNA_ORIENTATION=+
MVSAEEFPSTIHPEFTNEATRRRRSSIVSNERSSSTITDHVSEVLSTIHPDFVEGDITRRRSSVASTRRSSWNPKNASDDVCKTLSKIHPDFVPEGVTRRKSHVDNSSSEQQATKLGSMVTKNVTSAKVA